MNSETTAAESTRLANILAGITTRDEAGRHFTERYADADIAALESLGLIEIDRPTHEPTGIPYDASHWSLEATESALEYIDRWAE
jgi:hypothetical protein